MFRLYAKPLLISILTTFLFTFSLYNLFHGSLPVAKYIISFLFYVLLTILLRSTIQNTVALFCIVFIPVLIIDLSVLIDGYELIPLRFPFATLFPAFGVFCGLLIAKRKFLYTTIVTFLILIFFLLSHSYFIPTIVWFMQKRSYVKLDNIIFSSSFKTINNDSVVLKDTLHAKVRLLELYFVKCVPCEQKYQTLEKLRKDFSEEQVAIVMICNGQITPYSEFISHQNANRIKGVTFLYDDKQIVERHLKQVKGYPTELLVNGMNELHHTIEGFSGESEALYYKNEKKQISKLLTHDK